MAKQLVVTTGDFELVDYSGSETVIIGKTRPVVVDNTSFIQARAAAGQIRVLETDLPDDATDEEFAGYWKESDGDQPLAVEAYKSSFTSESTKPKEETRRGRKPKDDETPKQE